MNLVVIDEEDYGQREAGSVYYAGYFMVADDVDPDEVIRIVETGGELTPEHGDWIDPLFAEKPKNWN